MDVFLIKLLCKILGGNFKRLVLLSTFYSQAVEDKIFSNIDFDKLNKNLKIANSSGAIQSALHAQEYVWKGIDLNQLIENASCRVLNEEKVTVENTWDLAEDIMDRLPEWVRYDRTKMRKDLQFLLCTEPMAHA